MLERSQKQNQTRRNSWLFAALTCAIVWRLPAIEEWRADLAQDRLYVRNELSEPIAKTRILFYGYGGGGDPEFPNHELVFRNVPGNDARWQHFEPKWGNGDSGRYFKIEGVTASGRKIGNAKVFEQPETHGPILDLGLGARFYITVRSDGILDVQPN